MYGGESLNFRPDGLVEKGLGSIQPGFGLAAVLGSIDRRRLSGGGRVALMRARARLVAHVQAEFLADVASVADSVQDEQGAPDFEFEADEIRAALLLTRRGAENQLGLAKILVERFPRLWEAMRAGELDLGRAQAIAEALGSVDQDTGRKIVDGLLDEAKDLTAGELRAKLAKEIIAADPEGAATRRREGVKERRVWAGPNPDGTADLMALGVSGEKVSAAMARIHELARATKSASDPRTPDQVRADVFLDLLLGIAIPGSDSSGEGFAGSGKGAVVDLRVDLTTLAGLDEKPGEIPGWGPVIADVARRVVYSQANAQWQVTVTGAEGQAVWTGTTRRRPDTAMRREVTTAVPTCIFPGCRMPASRSDLDHNQPWSEGGPTEPSNLAPLCRHDHRLKHEAGWQVRMTEPGTWTWTSPLGLVYQVGPSPP